MKKIDSIGSLETAYHELIPISAHMGIQVESYDGTSLRLKAPLLNNVNHQQSAFGGSLFSVAALAGWGIIQLKLGELDLDANTVIAGGDVSYSLPVFSDLLCECTLGESYELFAKKLLDVGKASIVLEPQILLDGKSAMSFSGKFVVKTQN